MKIYTKTGDDGTTGLFAGPRVRKDDPRIRAFGSVDELNSALGMVSVLARQAEQKQSQEADPSILHIVLKVQHDLFAIGAELATPQPDAHGTRLISDSHVERLEKWIDLNEAQLQPLSRFILPGGSWLAANLHWARTVCRRAEREVVCLAEQPGACDYSRAVIYLNRLGDLLFVLSRVANSRADVLDVAWEKTDAIAE